MLPTLERFLEPTYLIRSNYVLRKGFSDLYVRKGDIIVRFNNQVKRCKRMIQVANVTASHPGNGAFTQLVKDLVEMDLAVYVECAHNPRFQVKLISLGFDPVNTNEGPNYLFNHEGHLFDIEPRI